jgi:hypothetical protein
LQVCREGTVLAKHRSDKSVCNEEAINGSVSMNNVKVWPQLTVVFLVFAALGAGAVMLWTRYEPTVESLTVPSAARVERVDGEVGLSRNLSTNASDAQWIEVTPNTPLTVGDRLYARENSHAAIAFTGRNFARLDPGSSLDVVSLTDRRTQLALRDGSAIFNIGALQPGELFEVATPYGAIDLQQPGLYQVGYNDDGSAFVSVLSGIAQVIGLAGSGQIGKGEMLTLLGQTAAQIALSRLSPDYAGGLLDDYYGYQYPDLYDGRYRDYNAYLNDPYYYDPYNRYDSYQYVSAAIPGVYDLDNYGDWQNVNDYGYAWSPRVDAGWAPYQQGYWMMDDPYGLTWVSSEPWGYAPYHYGRWVNVNNRWFWVPESINTQPSYAPALVAFLPPTQENVIGWVPLAPGDPYATTFYDANWQPHYIGQSPVISQQFINLNVPGAVTVVPVGDFDQVIHPKMIAKFDRKILAGARPTLDPLSVAVLRQAALQTAIARRGFVLPPGLAKRLDTTQVYTSAQPLAPPFRDDLARTQRVAVVSEKQKKEKLQFKDDRRAIVAQEPGTAVAGKEERRLKQQEKAQGRAVRQQELRQPQVPSARVENERSSRGSEQRAQGERVGLTRQAQREAARQQALAAQQQQRALMQQQIEARRQVQQQAAQQAAAQRAQRQVERQQQVEGMRANQQQQRRRAEPQQTRPQPAVQMPQGQMRKQQAPAASGPGRSSGPPPQAAKPQGQGPAGKGKGRP